MLYQVELTGKVAEGSCTKTLLHFELRGVKTYERHGYRWIGECRGAFRLVNTTMLVNGLGWLMPQSWPRVLLFRDLVALRIRVMTRLRPELVLYICSTSRRRR